MSATRLLGRGWAYPIAPTDGDLLFEQGAEKVRQSIWIILDTEGSARGAMAFRILRPSLIITPLAASQLEVIQALKAAELVRKFGRDHRHVAA